MPNYTRLEQELLTPRQLALAQSSRGAALRTLSESDLHTLIADLRAAVEASAAAEAEGQVSARELLAAALRRANGEHRKRSADTKPAAKEDMATDDAVAAQTPAGKTNASGKGGAKPAKRVPASPTRKPQGRKTVETRKADLRTGSRRVAKSRVQDSDEKADTAGPVAVTASGVAPDSAPIGAKPDAAARQIPGKTAVPSPDGDKAAKKARKKADKAAKKAEKDAKAERKAAIKADRKAVKKAAKKEEKAAKKNRKIQDGDTADS